MMTKEMQNWLDKQKLTCEECIKLLTENDTTPCCDSCGLPYGYSHEKHLNKDK